MTNIYQLWDLIETSSFPEDIKDIKDNGHDDSNKEDNIKNETYDKSDKEDNKGYKYDKDI